MGPSFVETLPVRKFHGVGPATAKKMEQLGIETGRRMDLPGHTILVDEPAAIQRLFATAAQGGIPS